MITITVETDEEEAAIRAAHKDQKIHLGDDLPYTIRRGHRSIGGQSANTVMHTTDGAGIFAGGGGGGSGTNTPGGATGGPGAPQMMAGTCATCGNPVPGGGHTDQCSGLVPGSEYEIGGGGQGGR